MHDLTFKTIAELAALVRTREVSPVELTESFLDRIGAFDPQLNAFILVTAELARSQAKRAESELMRGEYRGPLHGMPLGLKDIYDTAGIRTSAHSKVCIDSVPAADATATRRLYDAGAVLLGKLATHEFAHGGPSFDLPWPPARNPWHLEHFTGGSSSGSGAATAAGLVAGALGTDTGGSIRSPASFCGLAGLKPTYGLVSRTGVIPNSYAMDHCGPLAWTVEDCAILLQAIAGHDPADPASAKVPIPDYRSALGQDMREVRVGVVRHFWEDDLKIDAELARKTEAVLDTMKALGAVVEPVGLRPLQEYHDVKTIISMCELFSTNHQDLIERPGDFGADYRGRGGLAGCLFQGADYVSAQRERRRMIDEMKPVYERFDVLVTPGAGPAPRLDGHRAVSFWEKPSFNSPFNVTGAPALIVCCGFSESGLPIGVQIAGRPFDERRLLAIGHAYERATPWRAKRPVLVPGALQPRLTPLADNSPANDVPRDVRETARVFAAQAGLVLNDVQFEQLVRAAPHALAMAGRVRRRRSRAEEPASVFRLS